MSIKSFVDTVGLGEQPAVYGTVEVNDLTLKLELDTGSEFSVVSSKIFQQLCSPKLHGQATLTAYGGYSYPVLRAMSFLGTFIGFQQQLELVIFCTDAFVLLSRILMVAFPALQTWLCNTSEVNSIATLDSTKIIVR